MFVPEHAANAIQVWHKNFKPTEFPDEVLEFLDRRVLEDIVFPLRTISGIPMMPSGLTRAHVRHDAPERNMHSTVNQTRFSFATDFQVTTFDRLMWVWYHARQMRAVGGLGIYFNLRRPTFHVDLFAERNAKLTWLVTSKEDGAEYIYLENDPVRFFKVLGEQLAKVS